MIVKLLFVCVQLLSNVPFAAPRKPNSPEGQGCLIWSHTISIAPSLRVLGHCDQRSKELDQDLLLDKGAIVAVGNPAYGTFHGAPRHLKASGEEVNFIEELFGKEYVVKLVGTTATPSEVLKCAKYLSEVLKKKNHPSKRGVKQAIFSAQW
jgi:hypothetical protein